MNELDNILESKKLSGFTGTPEGTSGGKWVQKLEESFKDYFGIRYAVAMNSATSALHASMIACDIGPGDEVIVTPYSFASSASCALMVGATPVFTDITDDTFNLDPIEIEKNITVNTKAIVVVHLFGHSADMNAIMKIANDNRLYVIEDAAQSIGATYDGRRVGTIGDIGVFSFNQSKHINTGEGGMLITDNELLATKVRAIRNHGEVSDPTLRMVGYNYRLPEIEAYLAYDQFQGLDRELLERHFTAGELADSLPCWITKPVVKYGIHAWWGYAMRVPEKRDIVLARLQSRGIACDKYVAPLYHLPIFGEEEPICPVAESMWRGRMLRIHMGGLTKDSIKVIIDTIAEV